MIDGVISIVDQIKCLRLKFSLFSSFLLPILFIPNLDQASPLCSKNSVFQEDTLFSRLKSTNHKIAESFLKIKIAEVDHTTNYKRQSSLRSKLALLMAEHEKVEDAFVLINEAIEIARAHNLGLEESAAVALWAYCYELQGKKEKALEFFLQAAVMDETPGNVQLNFWIHYHLGCLHYDAENYIEAALFMNKALAIGKQCPEFFDQNTDVLSALNTIGLAYRNLMNYDSAIYYHRLCLQMADARENLIWKAFSIGNIGIIMIRKQEYDSAYVFIRYDLEISLQNNEWKNVAMDYLYLGEISDHQSQFKTAEAFYDSSNQLIQTHKMKVLPYFAKISQHYALMKNFQMSYFYLQKFYDMRDSMQINRYSKALALINTNHAYEKKLVNLELMAKDNLINIQRLRIQRIIIVASLSIIILTAALIFMLHRRNIARKKLNKELKRKIIKRTRKLVQINKQLDVFIYRSSHDIRRPLTTLLGLNHLGQLTVKDENARQILNMVGETARTMDKMLQKLRMIHELKQMKPSLTSCNLQEVLWSEVTKLDGMLRRNEIDITTNIDYPQPVKTDPYLISIVINNLLENAIQFSMPKSKSRIILTLGCLSDYCFIEIADQGIGIERTIRGRIFQPFFRGSERSQGNGLGLFLVKETMSKLGGDVSLESEHGSGSKFRVFLPLKSENLMSK